MGIVLKRKINKGKGYREYSVCGGVYTGQERPHRQLNNVKKQAVQQLREEHSIRGGR